MAKKGTTPKTEKIEPLVEDLPLVEELEAPVEEVAPAPAKTESKSGFKAGLEHKPDPDTSPLGLEDFINASYMAMTNTMPLDIEVKHFMRSVEVIGFSRSDIHLEIRKSGAYQALHSL
jgi:hypothetical protein